MSIFIDKNTKVVVQGITGRDGSFHSKQMMEYGTKVVAGVTPGKGGQKFEEKVPVFNTVADAVEFLGTLRSRNVKLLCDLFHMNIEEADIGAALKLAGPLLGHVHFADSNRRAMGFGHTDVAPIVTALNALGYDGFVSAEVLPLPDGDAAAHQMMTAFRRWFPRP